MSFLENTFFLNQSEWLIVLKQIFCNPSYSQSRLWHERVTFLPPASSFSPSLPFINRSYYHLDSVWLALCFSLNLSRTNFGWTLFLLTILQLISVTISSMVFTIINLSLFFCSVLSYPNFNIYQTLPRDVCTGIYVVLL